MADFEIVHIRQRRGRSSWDGRVRVDGVTKDFGLGPHASRYAAARQLERRVEIWLSRRGAPARFASAGVAELLDAWIEHERAHGVVKGTYRKYEERMRLLIRELPLAAPQDLTLHAVQGWITRRGADYRPKTLSHYRSTAKAFSQFLVQAGVLASDPLASLPKIRAKHASVGDSPLSRDELAELVRVSPEPRRWLWVLLAYTGLRSLEARRLLVADVVLDVATPHVVVRAANAKNRTARMVALPTRDAFEAARLLVDGKDAADPVFATFPTWRTLKGDMQRAGLPSRRATGEPLGFHSFRVTAAELAADIGIGDDRIGDHLGHSSKAMTRVYRRRNLERTSAVLSMMPDLGLMATGLATDGPYASALIRTEPDTCTPGPIDASGPSSGVCAAFDGGIEAVENRDHNGAGGNRTPSRSGFVRRRRRIGHGSGHGAGRRYGLATMRSGMVA